MKRIIAILFSAAIISLNVSAQDVNEKLAAKAQNESAKVAEAFSLSKSEAKKFEEILYTRFVEQSPKQGMTEEEKYQLRKAALDNFRKNLIEAFGKERGPKIQSWYSLNIVRKQGSNSGSNTTTASPQTAEEKLKAKVKKETAMLASALNLTQEEADKYEKILYQRFVDMSTIKKDMSEEEKYQIRRAAVDKANAALDKTFGKEKANKMKVWYTNNIVRKNKK